MGGFNRIEAIALFAHSNGVLLRKGSYFGQLRSAIFSKARRCGRAKRAPLDLLGHLYFSYEQPSNFFEADPAMLLIIVSEGRAALHYEQDRQYDGDS